MANIFSGLFNPSSGGGGAAVKLAKYKQELEDYQDEKDAYEQQLSNQASREALQRVIDGMGSERQNMMRFYQKQADHRISYDSSQLGTRKLIDQRGSMIETSQAEKEDLAAKKAFLDYKILNPEPTDLQLNLADYTKLGDKSGEPTPAQIETLKFKRGEKFLEQEDQFVSTWNENKVVSKRLLEGGITKKLIPEYAQRLNEFYQTIDNAEDTLNFAQNRRDDIQKLYKDTNNFTTGPGSLLAGFVFTDAADWKRLKETVISNIGLSKIMELKAGSSQGATGLGALNEAELTMLQNHAGNLAGATNPAEIKRILRRLDRDLKFMQNTRMKGLAREKVFYNEYKRYLPHGSPDDSAWSPAPERAHLFTGGEYERPVIESPLDEEQDLETLLDQYAPITTGQ